MVAGGCSIDLCMAIACIVVTAILMVITTVRFALFNAERKGSCNNRLSVAECKSSQFGV